MNSQSNKNQEEILFRKFQANGNDKQQMQNLLFNGAFLGEPFDVICSCKDWFCDVVLNPYIKHQSENIYVAIHKNSGRLVGYLTGSLGGQEFENNQYNMVRRKVMSLAVSLSMPWTLFDHSNRLFATHIILNGENERPDHPESGIHWHYQVNKEFRKQGIGGELLKRFINNADKGGFRSIWAEVMAYPEKPRDYFENRGWSIYDAKPTKIFRDKINFPVEVLCITKPLADF